MSLEKVEGIDKIEVLESGHIQVRKVVRIMEDGQEIGKVYHRHVLTPGDSLSGESTRVIAVANSVWTEDVLKAFQKG